LIRYIYIYIYIYYIYIYIYINFIPTQSDKSSYCRSLSYQAQQQEVVQRVHLIVAQLLELNQFPMDLGCNLLTEQVLEAYERYDGDIEAIVKSITDDIREKHHTEDDEEWKDVRCFCVVCSSNVWAYVHSYTLLLYKPTDALCIGYLENDNKTWNQLNSRIITGRLS